jgi:hypothetical protein
MFSLFHFIGNTGKKRNICSENMLFNFSLAVKRFSLHPSASTASVFNALEVRDGALWFSLRVKDNPTGNREDYFTATLHTLQKRLKQLEAGGAII